MQYFKVRHVLYDNILNNEEIEKLIQYGKEGRARHGKVGTSINTECKIRYDIYMRNTDLLREIDKTINEERVKAIYVPIVK